MAARDARESISTPSEASARPVTASHKHRCDGGKIYRTNDFKCSKNYQRAKLRKKLSTPRHRRDIFHFFVGLGNGDWGGDGRLFFNYSQFYHSPLRLLGVAQEPESLARFTALRARCARMLRHPWRRCRRGLGLPLRGAGRTRARVREAWGVARANVLAYVAAVDAPSAEAEGVGRSPRCSMVR